MTYIDWQVESNRRKKSCVQKFWNTRVFFSFSDILLVCINQIEYNLISDGW
jgi:hypothetical protein